MRDNIAKQFARAVVYTVGVAYGAAQGTHLGLALVLTCAIASLAAFLAEDI